MARYQRKFIQPLFCEVSGCLNRSENIPPGQVLTFHKFTKTEEIKWAEFAHPEEPGWEPYPNARICSVHFSDQDLYKCVGRYRLKPGAVPSIRHRPITEVKRPQRAEEGQYMLAEIDSPSGKWIASQKLDLPAQTEAEIVDSPSGRWNVSVLAPGGSTPRESSARKSLFGRESTAKIRFTPRRFDHGYAKRPPPSPALASSPPSPAPVPLPPSPTSASLPPHPAPSTSRGSSGLPKSPSTAEVSGMTQSSSESELAAFSNGSEYEPGISTEEEAEMTDEDVRERDFVEEEKYIVFREELEDLMKTCQTCGSPVIKKDRSLKGTQAYTDVWNVQFLSRSTVQRLQNSAVYPVIQEAWIRERERLKGLIASKISSFPDGELARGLAISGDCRCDSPGHCAHYGLYSMMINTEDPELKDLIIEMELVDLAENAVKNSQALEPVGMQRALKVLLEEDGLNIRILATDRHRTIGSIMRKFFPNIDHQFDVWHVAKSLTKKLTAAARHSGGEELLVWKRSIVNHLWWSAATCRGDPQLLREKWISILHHVVDRHSWTGSQLFHRCGHAKLTRKERRETAWMKPDHASYEALQKIVMDREFLKALGQLNQFCHTGALEVFHSMLLKYCPKRIHFPHEGMLARSYLSGLDWNRQVHALPKVTSSEQVQLVHSKRAGGFVLKRKAKRYTSRSVISRQLLKRAAQVCRSHITLPRLIVPSLHRRISKVAKPDKTEIFNIRHQRMAKE